MSKKQKKRNKSYRGKDARTTGVIGQDKPIVHRYEAIHRNPLNQWLHDHRRGLKISAITSVIILFIVIMIIGLTQTFSR